MDVETYAQAIPRLARGCASTAWTVGHLIEHVWTLARWPQQVQDEVFANSPTPFAAATSAPVGVATKVPGGYAISGVWSFASGVMHSEWATDEERAQSRLSLALSGEASAEAVRLIMSGSGGSRPPAFASSSADPTRRQCPAQSPSCGYGSDP